MKKLSKGDVLSAVVTGVTTGVIGWRILVFLGKPLPLGIDPAVLALLVPFLWVAGVQLGYALATMFRPMGQFGKFAAIGFTNAAVDFGVLYLLIALTGKVDGWHYTLFKTASFTVSAAHSYFWNKTWAFNAADSHGGTAELLRFLGVALASIIVNVAVASSVVAVGPAGGLDARAWAGVGAIAGSAAALIFSFVGFRLLVFRKS